MRRKEITWMYEGVSYGTLHQGRIKVNANIENNLDSMLYDVSEICTLKKMETVTVGAVGAYSNILAGVLRNLLSLD